LSGRSYEKKEINLWLKNWRMQKVKKQEKLRLRFKFNDKMTEEKSDEILFRVFDILFKEVPKDKDSQEFKGHVKSSKV
jgi:hypothetical protein